jgi:hypothetical protein
MITPTIESYHTYKTLLTNAGQADLTLIARQAALLAVIEANEPLITNEDELIEFTSRFLTRIALAENLSANLMNVVGASNGKLSYTTNI